MLATHAHAPIIIAGNRNALSRNAKEFGRPARPGKSSNVLCPSLSTINIAETQAKSERFFLRRIITSQGTKQSHQYHRHHFDAHPNYVPGDKPFSRWMWRKRSWGANCSDVGVLPISNLCKWKTITFVPSIKVAGNHSPKRTAEGDIGMRYSITVARCCRTRPEVCELSGLSEERASELASWLRHLLGCSSKWWWWTWAPRLRAGFYGYRNSRNKTRWLYGRNLYRMRLTYVQTGKQDLWCKQIIVTGGGAHPHENRSNRISCTLWCGKSNVTDQRQQRWI